MRLTTAGEVTDGPIPIIRRRNQYRISLFDCYVHAASHEVYQYGNGEDMNRGQ